MIHAPIDLNKTHCPTTKLSFVGLGIDTDTQPFFFIPVVKCLDLQISLALLFCSKKISLREMQ